jgi:pimeloyl-ACP methyl ester carboxylesterase
VFVSWKGLGIIMATIARNHRSKSDDETDHSRLGPRREHSDPPVRRGHIGLIIAGSLLTGLIAALILVLGPFGGAQETVISGTALLAFALGWALIAVLSARWTDQPQRWAAAPAALMALLGMGLLLFAPGNSFLEAAGWVWPIPVLALVIWMVVHARRHLRSRTRPWLLYPVFGVMALAAVGGSYERIQESLDRNAYAMSGRLVDVGGHRLHIQCTGSGSPTVVLESGLGEPSMAMSGWIAPSVARSTRTCVYDRAGRGWSEPASGSQDGVAAATDLHTLLSRAHVVGPYVLAGHSSGAQYVRIFADRYPTQVAGMVLLDGQPATVWTKLSGWSTFYSMFRRVGALMPSLYRLGVGRLVYMSAYSGLPSQARNEERAFWSTPRHAQSLRNEFAELLTALDQANRLRSIGNKPLIVVTAMKDAQDGWLPLQNEMARLSTNSRHLVLANATHDSLTDDKHFARVSSQAILDVVRAVRTAKPLTR